MTDMVSNVSMIVTRYLHYAMGSRMENIFQVCVNFDVALSSYAMMQFG